MRVSGHDDDALLARAAQGDGEAFAFFYRRHLAAVVGYLLRRTRDREASADLAAEVFATALASAGRFEPGGPPALAWLFGIAANKLRGSGVYVIPVEGIAGERPWPARCLHGLPPKLRRQLARGTPDRIEPMLCVLSGGGGSCGLTPEGLRREGSFGAATVGRGDTLVTGIVPDGVTSVVVAYGRSRRTFSVHANVVSFLIGLSPEQASSPDRLTWQLADGSTRTVHTRRP